MNNNQLESLLMAAIESGDFLTVRQIIEHNQQLNLDANDGRHSLLNYAIVRYDSKILEYLLKKGANPNFKPAYGTYPIITATLKENQKSVELLIQYGADVNVVDADGATALHHIADKNLSIHIFLDLLKKGANPNIKANNGYTVTMTASSSGRDIMLQDLILNRNVDFTATNNIGENFIDIVKYGSVVYILKLYSIQEKILTKNPELYTSFKTLNIVNPDIDVKFPHLASGNFLNLL